MLNGIAYAMGQGGAAGAGGQGGFTAFIPLILMFVIFYFLLIRPQQKKQKEHQEMLNSLKKGDRIITGGGMYARIISVDDSTLSVEIADKIRVKVSRATIAGVVTKGQAEKNDKDDSDTLKSK